MQTVTTIRQQFARAATFPLLPVAGLLALAGLALWLSAVPLGTARGYHHQRRWTAGTAQALNAAGMALMFPKVPLTTSLTQLNPPLAKAPEHRDKELKDRLAASDKEPPTSPAINTGALTLIPPTGTPGQKGTGQNRPPPEKRRRPKQDLDQPATEKGGASECWTLSNSKSSGACPPATCT